jgi:SAM-dependent methyltransferase
MRAASPASCRVLELGAGDGGNLIPMAVTLPASTFVGIDLAGDAVARGREQAAALGAGNLELRQADLLDLPGDLGEFDYIIAHGVYSWIPPKPRNALLGACAQHLAPHGVAYVSYNAYPGSYLRDMAGDIMRFHVEGVAEPEARLGQARALMQLVIAANAGTPYAGVLRDHFERVLQHPDALLFHDDLAEVNTPVYFHEFVEHAGRHGLQFLSEARLQDSQLHSLPDDVARALDELSGDIIVREQYFDFVVNRMFRQTLLCRGDVSVARTLDTARLEGLSFAAVLEPEDGEDGGLRTYRGRSGSRFQPQVPQLAAALDRLAVAWPRAVSFADLRGDGPDATLIARGLLEVHAAGLVDLHTEPPQPAATAGEHPTAYRVARHQAAGGSAIVTSLRHMAVNLEDPLAVHLLTLLDGTRNRAALVAAIRAFVAGGGLEDTGIDPPPDAELPAALETALDRLAKLSLLTG